MNRTKTYGSILIVDKLPLRRSQMLAFLTEWSRSRNFRIADCEISGLMNHEDPGIFDLVVINIGSDDFAGSTMSRAVRVVKAICPQASIAIIGERQDAKSVMSAIRMEVSAYIPSRMEPGVVFSALDFVLEGGTYFPADVLRDGLAGESPLPPGTGSPPDTEDRTPRLATPRGNRTLPGLDDPDEDGDDTDPDTPIHKIHTPDTQAPSTFGEVQGMGLDIDLTPRQLEVLNCLSMGQPNKVIARQLDMSEATVKVHVRHLMKRLGASNRTQAAVMAVQRLKGPLQKPGMRESLRLVSQLREDPKPAPASSRPS